MTDHPRQEGAVMSERRLTDEELRDFAEYCEGNDRAMRVVAELRDLRSLLATPMPNHFSRYELPGLSAPDQHGERTIGCAPLREDLTWGDALAYGAAWIRAAIQAKGGAR